NEPACLLLENVLYFFEKDVDGKKLSPFLNKRFISIPRSAEQSYFKKFIGPLIEKHHVYAEGFDIKTQQYDGTPIIEFSYPAAEGPVLKVKFKYGLYTFSDISGKKVSVKLEYNSESDSYTFYRVKRSVQWEARQISFLKSLGLHPKTGLSNQFEIDHSLNDETGVEDFSLINWLNEHIEELKENGFEVIQRKAEKQYL